ncbi:PQQ-dependent sugar dehydrogenase [Caldimonas brevitalea]|uniref:Cytochrome c551/c552 n=1 Tax=Caldimonas brevitalea TaxID=413882 RepID=A0A0G3BJ26_9BURK|nr:PQQ-dependent sugar dehydrogenase [Caldimonas brevitalea]AKJ27998.1 cytochrome c551/c552 [Caldimonas brevitalea]
MNKTFWCRAVTCAAISLAGPAFGLEPALIASGLDQPVFLTAPTGDSRLFVVEKGGRIKLLHNGSVSTYLDISAKVDADGERGLLGLAFDPGFRRNGRFYVNYIDKTTQNTVVASYTAPSFNANSANPASARTILTVEQTPDSTRHKAGWIGFRPNDPGQLYVATGDGGPSNDPFQRAQDPNSNLGKILRITPQADGGYTVPTGNPFVGRAGNDEVWSFGLRNPYRNSFDRATGDLWIADVGEAAREEVDFEAAGSEGGRNYGWRALEGSADNPDVPDAAPEGAIAPLFEYEHGALGRSVIGGYVYRGGLEEGLDGAYLFGDFASGKIFSLHRQGDSFVDFVDRSAELGNLFGRSQLTSFGEDAFGALYVMGLDGNVYRIAAAVPEPEQWALLLGGGAWLAAVVRRRRGSASRP